MWSHASWVSNERSEEKMRRERTCVVCQKETVYNGKCSECGTSGKIEDEGIQFNGEFYTSMEDMKRRNPHDFMEYNRTFMDRVRKEALR